VKSVNVKIRGQRYAVLGFTISKKVSMTNVFFQSKHQQGIVPSNSWIAYGNTFVEKHQFYNQECGF
jgi:hypothetical protein